MKRKLVMILGCMMAVLVGCSSQPKTDSEGTSEPSETVVESTVAGETDNTEQESIGVNDLTIWAIQSEGVSDYETNGETLWYEEKTGVHVNWVQVPQQGWADSFKNFFLSEETADIYLYDFSTSEVSAIAGMGGIIPLNDLIEQYAPNIKAILDNNPEIKESITALDGNIYTLFKIASNTESAYTQKLWVRDDWLTSYEEATGNPMPETTDDFKKMLEYFRDNDMNENGDTTDEIPYIGMNGVDGIYFFADSFIPCNSSSGGYGCYPDKEGNLVFSYNTDAFKNALIYMKGLYNDGLLSDESFTIDKSNRYLYTSGDPAGARAGVVTGVMASDVVQLSDSEGTLDYSDYVALPPLKGPDGQRNFVISENNSISLVNAISSTCKDPIAAIKWLDYFYSEEGREYGVYGGIQGTDWDLEQGETVKGSGEVVTRITELTDNFCWQGGHAGVNYAVQDEDLLRMDATNIASNNILATYKANLSYKPYLVETGWPSIVWSDDEDAAQEYSELVGLIVDHVTENYTEFILGQKDIETEWDAYVKEFENIGLEKYIELVNLYIQSAE